jgi:hypothetical protein
MERAVLKKGPEVQEFSKGSRKIDFDRAVK